jgi:hypothetical protein
MRPDTARRVPTKRCFVYKITELDEAQLARHVLPLEEIDR